MKFHSRIGTPKDLAYLYLKTFDDPLPSPPHPPTPNPNPADKIFYK